MNRQVLLLDLRDDPQLIAEYEAWHAPGKVPAAIIKHIVGSGIVGMEIFRTGNRLVMIMDVGPQFDLSQTVASDQANPEVEAWERLMDGFQQRLPWGGPGQKWVPAERIFDLDEQGG